MPQAEWAENAQGDRKTKKVGVAGSTAREQGSRERYEESGYELNVPPQIHMLKS